MGKGYNNFMSKKAFHPGSQANRKRVYEAEAKAEAKRKHDEETLAQYLREQELLDQKSLVSKQSKEKLSLNFMYEAPPGVEKPKQTDKVEFKGSDGKTVAAAPAAGSSQSSEICLEWKRSKPVKKSNLDVKPIKTEPIVKTDSTVKTEPTSTTTTTKCLGEERTTKEMTTKTEPIVKKIKSER